MKIQTLLETPIEDYALLGKWGKDEQTHSKHFGRAVDRKLVTSDNLIRKTRKKFANTDFVFNLYFVNLPGLKDYQEYGIIDMETLEDMLPKVAELVKARQEQEGTDDSESINVIFVNNSGANKVPMTSWIMAHRIGHAIRKYGGLKANPAWEEYIEDINHMFSMILEDVYGIHVKRNIYGGIGISGDNYDRSLGYFFEALGTMSSARNGKLRERPYEFYYELFSQYLLTGSIKMNPPPHSFGGRVKFYARYEDSRESWANEFNRAGYSYLDQIESRLDNVLYSAQGKYLLM